MTYTGSSRSPVQYNGWSFHINTQTAIGNKKNTYYSYVVVPASLVVKSRFVPTVNLIHNGGSAETTNVRIALYSTFTAGTGLYSDSIGESPPQFLSSEKSVTVAAGTTGTVVDFKDPIPENFVGMATATNAFVAIGISNTAVQWRPSFNFAIQ